MPLGNISGSLQPSVASTLQYIMLLKRTYWKNKPLTFYFLLKSSSFLPPPPPHAFPHFSFLKQAIIADKSCKDNKDLDYWGGNLLFIIGMGCIVHFPL